MGGERARSCSTGCAEGSAGVPKKGIPCLLTLSVPSSSNMLAIVIVTYQCRGRLNAYVYGLFSWSLMMWAIAAWLGAQGGDL